MRFGRRATAQQAAYPRGELDMSEDVYKRLASRLDAIPNGFPATESGVELKILAKIFTPDQAALAGDLANSSHVPPPLRESKKIVAPPMIVNPPA